MIFLSPIQKHKNPILSKFCVNVKLLLELREDLGIDFCGEYLNLRGRNA
jgi:hypothetical protein